MPPTSTARGPNGACTDAELQKAKKDPALAAAGAVLFLETVSRALEQVDSSSGAIGTAVNHAIETCANIIAEAPVDDGGWVDEIERRIRALIAGPRSTAKDLIAASLGTSTIS